MPEQHQISGRMAEFTLTNPTPGSLGAHCFLLTDRAELMRIAAEFVGVMAIFGTEIAFKPFYDAEVVWLNLYDALEGAARLSPAWYDALEEKDKR